MQSVEFDFVDSLEDDIREADFNAICEYYRQTADRGEVQLSRVPCLSETVRLYSPIAEHTAWLEFKVTKVLWAIPHNEPSMSAVISLKLLEN